MVEEPTQQNVELEETRIEEEPARKLLGDIIKAAPDILEVGVATMVNPIAGVGLVVKKLADQQKIAEAKVQQAAEEKFREKVSVYNEEYQTLIEPDNLHKTAVSLAREAVKLAEDAVKVDDQALLPEVSELYRKSLKQLLSSTPDKPLGIKQLAEIRTELALVRLKVMWADAQQEARYRQKLEEERIVREQLQEISKRENARQLRVFLILLFYVAALTIALLFGGQNWSTNTTVPWPGIPASIVFWSALGSVANMLYKYYKQAEMKDRELRWVWTRPLLGIVMSAVTYLVLMSVVIVIGAATRQNINIQIKPELYWLVAFVSGFSDKIVEGIMGRIGLSTTDESKEKAELRDVLQSLAETKKQTKPQAEATAEIVKESDPAFDTLKSAAH